MTPLRSFAFLAFLMVFSSTGTTRAAMEETTNLINDPFQSTSCLDAQMYCEQTITPAIEQDSTLTQFLLDERKEAKRTQSWESVVPEERMKQMKVPETLALGTFGVGVGVGVLCVRMRSILTELSSFSFSLTLSLSLCFSLSMYCRCCIFHQDVAYFSASALWNPASGTRTESSARACSKKRRNRRKNLSRCRKLRF